MSNVAQRTAAVVAILFGLATLFAGGRVLMGYSDPGYVVYRPLLIYNTVMGFAYIAAGVAIWVSRQRGKYAASAIFIFNLAVLLGVVFLYANGGAVAIDSVRAMAFRTSVWLALLVVLAWKVQRWAP
ncbi:MAG TPA: hypothetical protein VN663_12630 [Ramlibacter sp.]|nr:hypothetical protein [Ramlibacter sp.]